MYSAKKVLRKFYHLLCFLLRLSNLKILFLIVTNVIFVRMFLYLTLNSNARLQVDYIISEVNLLVMALIFFIWYPVLTVIVSMYGLLYISEVDLEFPRVILRPKNIGLVLLGISTLNVLIVLTLTSFWKYRL